MGFYFFRITIDTGSGVRESLSSQGGKPQGRVGWEARKRGMKQITIEVVLDPSEDGSRAVIHALPLGTAATGIRLGRITGRTMGRALRAFRRGGFVPTGWTTHLGWSGRSAAAVEQK